MSVHVSGPCVPVWPESVPMPDELLWCCMGAAVYGPDHCTCWVPLFDVEQTTQLQPDAVAANVKCCHDCAYRHGSPERVENGGDPPSVPVGAAFWCHQGMRRVIAWQHPLAPGLTIPAGPGDYRPAIVNGIAYRADGTVADLCAGWRACGGARAVSTHRRINDLALYGGAR